MSRFVRWLPVLPFLVLAACRDELPTQQPGPDGEGIRPASVAPRPEAVISDARTDGNPSFYFLWPIVTERAPRNLPFDGAAQPSVSVCRMNGDTCGAVVAEFPWAAGRGLSNRTTREYSAFEFYLATWWTPFSGAGLRYRATITSRGKTLGFADIKLVRRSSELRGVPQDVVGVIAGLPLPIVFRIEIADNPPPPPPPPPLPPVPPATAPCRNCLEVVPSALLLPGVGASLQLVAYRVDAAGQRTQVAATFASSAAGVVTVSASGVATAAGDGSAQIIAQADGMTSAPVLALVTTPAAGALLVADAQILTDPAAVNPSAVYGPGWQYRVRLAGVSPQVGQIILGTGWRPVGGRVVSVNQVAPGEVEVVLALVTLKEMFPALNLNETIPLTNIVAVTPSAPAFATSRPFAADEPGVIEFDVGPFSCEAKIGLGLSFPLTVSAVTHSIATDLDLDVVFTSGDLKRLVVHGTISPQMTAKPQIDGEIEGSAECKVHLATIILPFGGPLALIASGQVPIGIGFGLEAKTELGGFGFDASFGGTVSASFGIACPVTCGIVSDLTQTSNGTFKPVYPTAADLKAELTASFFGYAELKFGNPIFTSLQFKAMDVKGGLQQGAELATMATQVADPEYASSIELKGFIKGETSSELNLVGNLLSINLAEFSFEPDFPVISESPKGAFTITPVVSPGNASELGEMATFTVDLNPVTFAQLDAVDKVEIKWLRDDGSGNLTLENGRPGCTSIARTAPGQTQYTCQADFLEEHIGVQTFYAFVHARILGVPIPVPLEINDDGKATVEVLRFGSVHLRRDQPEGQFLDIQISTTTPLPPLTGPVTVPGSWSASSRAVIHEAPVGTLTCTRTVDTNGSGESTFTVTPTPQADGSTLYILTFPSTRQVHQERRCVDSSNGTSFTQVSDFPTTGTVTMPGARAIMSGGNIVAIRYRSSDPTIILTGALKVTVP